GSPSLTSIHSQNQPTRWFFLFASVALISFGLSRLTTLKQARWRRAMAPCLSRVDPSIVEIAPGNYLAGLACRFVVPVPRSIRLDPPFLRAPQPSSDA